MTTSPPPLATTPTPVRLSPALGAAGRPPSIKPRGVHNGGLPVEAKALARWQALVAGRQLRRTLSVTTLAPGMVGVRLYAWPSFVDRVGLQDTVVGQPATDGSATATRRLDWISLDPSRFSGRVVQGDGLLDTSLPPEDGQPNLACVRLSGGYFNFLQRACPDRPEHLSIGPSRGRGGALRAALPLPTAYAGDYCELVFPDGSSLACAPLLGEQGEPVFAVRADGDPRYRLPPDFSFERGDQVAPGVLWHAHDANPRAAISMPTVTGKGARIRLVAAPMDQRTSAGSGWTLSAFSGALARLDRMQDPPNVSLNLDGGESVALSAWVGGRPLLDSRQTLRPRRVGNLIEFRATPPSRSPRLVRCVKLGS